MHEHPDLNGLPPRERDIVIGKLILLAAAEEGAIDNFNDDDFLLVTKKAKELLYPDTDQLGKALQNIEQRVRVLLHDVNQSPAEAERYRLAKLLGQIANEMFNSSKPVYPSNLLDVISAWMSGWSFGERNGHFETEKPFLEAAARAEAKLAERATATGKKEVTDNG